MTTLSEQDIQSFKEQGYHVARGVFDADEIRRLGEGG